uniref:Uncharacterized protein n=1 Tax=Zea mays TaxID=4577 RepID=A0A804LXT8_MAIZE
MRKPLPLPLPPPPPPSVSVSTGALVSQPLPPPPPPRESRRSNPVAWGRSEDGQHQRVRHQVDQLLHHDTGATGGGLRVLDEHPRRRVQADLDRPRHRPRWSDLPHIARRIPWCLEEHLLLALDISDHAVRGLGGNHGVHGARVYHNKLRKWPYCSWG